jgi:hypothetical protein
MGRKLFDESRRRDVEPNNHDGVLLLIKITVEERRIDDKLVSFYDLQFIADRGVVVTRHFTNTFMLNQWARHLLISSKEEK